MHIDGSRGMKVEAEECQWGLGNVSGGWGMSVGGHWGPGNVSESWGMLVGGWETKVEAGERRWVVGNEGGG